MKALLIMLVILATALGGGALWYFNDTSSGGTAVGPNTGGQSGNSNAKEQALAAVAAKKDLIYLTTPEPGGEITSPLEITGMARGTWFFEGSFPVSVLNRNGQVVARGVAQAQGEWMTEEFVPFRATLTFKSPYISGDPVFFGDGTLVLIKDNPSGLPENDDSLRVPIQFAPNTETKKFSISIPKPVTIYDGIEVMDSVTSVDVSGRGLSGSLKAEVRMLTKLERLDLSNNNFTGLPAEVGQLSELRILNLSNNPFTGLPYELGNLKNLQQLDLRGTQYSEADLAVIRQAWTQEVEVLTDSEEEMVEVEATPTDDE